jgi:hypothetical protein
VVKTLAVDKYQRVRLPDVKGGQRFAYENKGNGVLVLTEVKPVEAKPVKARLVKNAGGYTVIRTDQPIDEQALKLALAEFP